MLSPVDFAGPLVHMTILHLLVVSPVDSVQHDSYTCQRFPGYTVPFPTRREANDTTQYLGQVVRPPPAAAEKLHECPAQCRPRQHPDWEYC